MRTVCGLVAPTSSDITLLGSRNLVSQRFRVGYTIENPALYPTMTALENMEIQRLLLGIKEKKICGELLEMSGLNYLIHYPPRFICLKRPKGNHIDTGPFDANSYPTTS